MSILTCASLLGTPNVTRHEFPPAMIYMVTFTLTLFILANIGFELTKFVVYLPFKRFFCTSRDAVIAVRTYHTLM